MQGLNPACYDVDMRERVQKGLVSADRLASYYGELGERFDRYNKVGLMGIATLSLAAILVTWADVGQWYPVGIAAAIILVSLGLSYADYSRKAGTAAGIASICMELIGEWEDLWHHISDNDAPAKLESDATVRLENLDRRLTAVTVVALHQHGFLDKKLNERCQDDATRRWKQLAS